LNAAVVPIHENVVQNFANVEIFNSGDKNEEDCLGWITIMEKCETNLRKALRSGNPDLEGRKKIAKGIQAGLKYLEQVGITHLDKKLANFLLIGDVAKICDFGIIQESSGRKKYRELGYARRGSKYQTARALCMVLNFELILFYIKIPEPRHLLNKYNLL
jgi:serine/threonine protein kinase